MNHWIIRPDEDPAAPASSPGGDPSPAGAVHRGSGLTGDPQRRPARIAGEIISPVTARGLHRDLRPPREAGPAAGAVALLVHGTMDRATSFTRMAQQLRDWSVLTYDRRGYAKSAGVAPTTRFADQVDDLLDVTAEVGPVIGFGHSLGGAVVLAAAARQPQRFRGVVAYEPPAPWTPWWGARALHNVTDPAAAAERFMRQVLGDELWERLPASTRAQRRSEGGTMVAEIVALGEVRPFDPAAITVPVIVARGSEAAERHIRSAQELAGSIPGAEFVIVAGADHGAHISHPAEMAALIRQVAARADR